MNVDISALRKFEDTFGPAIAAIPAVIDAINGAKDVERHIALKQQELQKVMEDIEAIRKEGEVFVEQMQAKGDAIVTAADNYAAEKQAQADAALASATEAKKLIEEQMLALSDKRTELANKVANIERETADRIAALNTQHEEAVQRTTAEIVELEERKAKAEKALASLRAKLEV